MPADETSEGAEGRQRAVYCICIPGQAGEVGLCEPHEVQQGQVQDPASGSILSIKRGWGMKGLKAALPRRTWGCWWRKSTT